MERVLVILVHWTSQRGQWSKEKNRETENITFEIKNEVL